MNSRLDFQKETENKSYTKLEQAILMEFVRAVHRFRSTRFRPLFLTQTREVD